MKTHVVYLTRYRGDKLPPWYIGSSFEENVLNGYTGSVQSKKWKVIYYNELKENRHLFKTRILSYHSTREEAVLEELRLQQMHLVMTSEKYFNESYASPKGFFGRDVSGELNPFYGKTHTQESKDKRNESLNVINEDGITIREQSIIKMTKTKNMIEGNGLTNAQNTAINGAKTRTTKILDNGLTVAQDNALKGVETKTSTILDNGLNILQNASRKCLVTKRNTILDNGLTIEEAARLKQSQTLTTTILDNGLTIAQDIGVKGAATRANTILDNGLTIDQNAGLKQSQTKLSKEWKDTIGKESSRKMAITMKNKPMLTCPHCGIQTNSTGNMARWHNENCKMFISEVIDTIV